MSVLNIVCLAQSGSSSVHIVLSKELRLKMIPYLEAQYDILH